MSGRTYRWAGPPDDAALQRAALWSAYFHRFFGRVGNGLDVPTGFRPMSPEESCDALYRVVSAPRSAAPRPDVLKRYLWQTLYAGSRVDQDHPKKFDTLVKALGNRYRGVSRQNVPRGAQLLLQEAHRQYGSPTGLLTQPVGLEERFARADRADQVVSDPPTVTYEGHTWTVTIDCLIRCPLEGVAQVVNPPFWEKLAPLFWETRKIEGRRLHETLHISWNGFTEQTFDVVLKIDYTKTPKLVRADYSLEYEEDDQILVDDGFAEASRDEQDPMRTRYRGRKSIRFTSAFLNLLAPAVLCMVLENQSGGFQHVLETTARDNANKPTGKRSAAKKPI